MLKILVVEDDTEKLRRVLKSLEGMTGVDLANVENVRDANSAKKLMKECSYDLLILDISLPEKPEMMPDRDGGIKLLDEILEREIFQKPQHIVGLTAFADIMETASIRFGKDLWLTLFYDPASDSWVDSLQRKVKHILLARQSSHVQGEYRTDLCIITAVRNPELRAILRLPWSWQTLEIPNDGTVYYRGEFQRDGAKHEVIAASAPRMGMAAASVLSMKMVNLFAPKYLAIGGILAGAREVCGIGDVIVADPSWDYGSGKHLVENGISRFAPAPYQIPLDPYLRGRLNRMAQESSVFDEIRHAWQGKCPDTVLKMHLGPVGSGAAVLADSSILTEVRGQHRKLIGIEMETYGVFCAAEESVEPRPAAFSMKAVSDFADELKSDDFQEFAAFTSAMSIRIFVERYV